MENPEVLKKLIGEIVVECLNRHLGEAPAIPVGISNRHVHLSQRDMEILFGFRYKPVPMKQLSQTGQYAAQEVVTLIGPKGVLENVRILGPSRDQTQIELLMSDAYSLGIKPPVRESGDLDGTPGLMIAGTKGAITLDKGVIVAKRHIHMSPSDAQTYGIRDREEVQVHIQGERELIFDKVTIRVHSSFNSEFHIDIDEANAAGIQQGEKVRIVKKKRKHP